MKKKQNTFICEPDNSVIFSLQGYSTYIFILEGVVHVEQISTLIIQTPPSGDIRERGNRVSLVEQCIKKVQTASCSAQMDAALYSHVIVSHHTAISCSKVAVMLIQYIKS